MHDDTSRPLLQIMRTPPSPGDAPLSGARPSLGPSAVEWPAVAERFNQQYAAGRLRRTAVERCEMCGAEIAARHGHVVNVPSRELLCVCRPCYLLFTHQGAGGLRFRVVPERYRWLSGFEIARAAWDTLQVPIGLAFFLRNSATGRIAAFYPSPAGATESELPLESWDMVAAAVPALADMEPDVEGLLVRRWPRSGSPGDDARRDSRATQEGPRRDEFEAFIAPIDACYELVGRIRRSWRGFQGGDDVWCQIDDFFTRARERAESQCR